MRVITDIISNPQGVARLYSAANIGIVGGRVEFFFENAQNPTAIELYDSIRNLQQEAYIHKVKYAATANLFTLRRVFERVGFFDASVTSGGDRDWRQRVAASGYDLVYGHDVCVRHPTRRTLGQLYHKVARVVGGHHQLKSRTGHAFYHYEFLKYIALDLSPPVRFVPRLIRDSRVEGL